MGKGLRSATEVAAALCQLTVFDFNQTAASGAQEAPILLAMVDNFPILEGLGVGGTISFVGPCGLNIHTSIPCLCLTTVSPPRSRHSLGNTRDPGRSDIATNLWRLPDDTIDASLGFPMTVDSDTINAWRAHLPVNLAVGVDSCLQLFIPVIETHRC
ncbi:hypothetical protein DFH07DRAFT_774684 [Mycena maculata]|uniref:Uncharacterized protein n=1 Tax=Mycena maculata TaxID=230809 RepID=A0AAD7IY53_9AGAR|nr:hypothetical protein DFH07DRAFT_774684 [Mycena maculata]